DRHLEFAEPSNPGRFSRDHQEVATSPMLRAEGHEALGLETGRRPFALDGMRARSAAYDEVHLALLLVSPKLHTLPARNDVGLQCFENNVLPELPTIFGPELAPTSTPGNEPSIEREDLGLMSELARRSPVVRTKNAGTCVTSRASR